MVLRSALTGMAGVLLGLVVSARADLAPPPEPPEPPTQVTKTVPVQVEFKTKIDRPRVRIPESVWKQLKLAAADRDEGAFVSLGGAAWRTIAAGLAMSSAVVLFLILRRSRTASTAVTGALLLGVGIGSSAVLWANVPPPIEPPDVPEIDIAVVADGESVVIVVDEDLYKRIEAARSSRRYRPNRRRPEPVPPNVGSAPNDGAAAPEEAPQPPTSTSPE